MFVFETVQGLKSNNVASPADRKTSYICGTLEAITLIITLNKEFFLCNKCNKTKKLFKTKFEHGVDKYISVVEHIKTQQKEGILDLVFGDCEIEQALKNLGLEEHFTVCHFLQCCSCKQGFHIGACIRGTPYFRLKKLPSKNKAEKLLWGRSGSFYATDQSKSF